MTVAARRSLAIPGCPRSARLLLAAAFAPRAGRLVDLRRLLDASQAYDGVNHAVDALFGGDERPHWPVPTKA